MSLNLRVIEQDLEARGDTQELRAAIRNSRILIIDDRIEDLKSLTSSLKKEGFTNVVELKKVTSIDDLLSRRPDLVVLDLTGVAADISADDGFGVLESVKSASPGLPVLVVTGTPTPPSKVSIIEKADLVRDKPVKALELLSDVELLLRPFKDQDWGSLEILKELRRLQGDIQSETGWRDWLALKWRKRQLEKRLRTGKGDAVYAISEVAKLVAALGAPALKIVEIARRLGD